MFFETVTDTLEGNQETQSLSLALSTVFTKQLIELNRGNEWLRFDMRRSFESGFRVWIS